MNSFQAVQIVCCYMHGTAFQKFTHRCGSKWHNVKAKHSAASVIFNVIWSAFWNRL